MSDAETKRLTHAEYWNEHYADVRSDQQVHEWYKSYGDLELFFDRHMFKVKEPTSAPKILHLGSGDSTIPLDFASRGYHDQVCVDFSSVVVQAMSAKHAQVEGITWLQADVRQLDQILSSSIDIAFDKGTLDSMVHGSPWNPPDDVLKNTSQYIREVDRVLKSDGIFMYVTYLQPHFIKPLLNCGGTSWDIQVSTLGGSKSSFHYHGFVLTKTVSMREESRETDISSGV